MSVEVRADKLRIDGKERFAVYLWVDGEFFEHLMGPEDSGADAEAKADRVRRALGVEEAKR